MKLFIAITVLVLIVNSQCAPFEHLFGTVKNTTGAIKQDIRGLFSHGRSLLFGDNHEDESVKKGKPAIPSQGLVDKVSIKIHDVSQDIQHSFQNVLKITDGDKHRKGIIKNVFDRVKDKIDKVKECLSSGKHTEDTKETEFNNVAPGNIINNTINNLHKNISEVSNSNEFDGSDSIDIRFAHENIAEKGKEHSENEVNGVDTAHNKIEDDGQYVKSKKKFDDFKETTNENFNKEKNDLHENVDKFIDGANKIRNDIDKHGHTN